jgi:membrane protein insertase Oxa1/YidC/SpoIIIJ
MPHALPFSLAAAAAGAPWENYTVRSIPHAYLDYVHDVTGTEWWLSIVIATLLVRAALAVPFFNQASRTRPNTTFALALLPMCWHYLCFGALQVRMGARMQLLNKELQRFAHDARQVAATDRAQFQVRAVCRSWAAKLR